eukprot:SAG31_NODE_10101_length_1182_cov_2.004617_2_plen_237_part_01
MDVYTQTFSIAGCTCGLPKKKRKGHPNILKLEIPQSSSQPASKMVLEFGPAQLDEWAHRLGQFSDNKPAAARDSTSNSTTASIKDSKSEARSSTRARSSVKARSSSVDGSECHGVVRMGFKLVEPQASLEQDCKNLDAAIDMMRNKTDALDQRIDVVIDKLKDLRKEPAAGGQSQSDAAMNEAFKCSRGRVKIEPPELMEYELRISVYQAEELIAADSSGFSDPYLEASIGGQSQRT